MYRLLIITKEPRAEQMFAAMEGWEAMGFKPPRLRKTVDEAMECMQKHAIDAIALDHDEAFRPLMDYLDENYPRMPIFEIMSNEQDQWIVMREVYQFLTQLHGDDSDDDHDEQQLFRQAQERWIKKVICGMAPTGDYIVTHHRMFRCQEQVDAPCLFARLAIPKGDSFWTERWHYGSDRLEVALRNFFGEEHDRMKMHVAVVSPEEVRVLVASTLEYASKADLTAERALGYIEETIEQIENYLGLSMNLIDIRTLANWTAFAAEERLEESVF